MEQPYWEVEIAHTNVDLHRRFYDEAVGQAPTAAAARLIVAKQYHDHRDFAGLEADGVFVETGRGDMDHETDGDFQILSVTRTTKTAPQGR